MPSPGDLRTIKLRDGRRLEYVHTGDVSGKPVFLLHGLPGGCLGLPDAPAQSGVCVIAPGRPGYGASDPVPGRRIADWTEDIEYLADHLGFARFAVIGYSMGGPYALACGCLLPGRVSAIALVSAAGSPWHTLVRRTAMLRPANWCADWPADRLSYWRRIAGNAFKQGLAGVVGDLAAWHRPWGFDAALVKAPILIYHGESDVVVPAHTSRRYEQLFPASTARYFPGEGHRALWHHFAEILHDVETRM